ncbi:MAG: TrmH family RNA methyltransferase [bacterium]|nr:TrmH family RNA methyltransferase [bacterium]
MRELHLIAHDIRSRENVGSLFRTADSLGVKKLWLTGYTPAPPDEKIAKVALGAEKVVPFEKVTDVEAVIARLKKDGIPLYALEIAAGAVELGSFKAPDRMALLLGTETTGVPGSLLSRCEGSIKINQKGVKESLNVSVAAGIAAWVLLNS